MGSLKLCLGCYRTVPELVDGERCDVCTPLAIRRALDVEVEVSSRSVAEEFAEARAWRRALRKERAA